MLCSNESYRYICISCISKGGEKFHISLFVLPWRPISLVLSSRVALLYWCAYHSSSGLSTRLMFAGGILNQQPCVEPLCQISGRGTLISLKCASLCPLEREKGLCWTVIDRLIVHPLVTKWKQCPPFSCAFSNHTQLRTHAARCWDCRMEPRDGLWNRFTMLHSMPFFYYSL